MSKSTIRSLFVTLVLFASCFGACGPPRTEPYGLQELERLEAGQSAPWAGWLMSDGDLEFLLKQAAGDP